MEIQDYVDKKAKTITDSKNKLASIDNHIAMVTLSRDRNFAELEERQKSYEKLVEIRDEVERLKGVIEDSQNKVAPALEENRKLTMDEKIEIAFIEECQREISELNKQAGKVYYNR